MPVPIGYRVRVNTPGIDRAPEIYSFYIDRHLAKLGNELQRDVRDIQRKDTGEERRRTRIKIVSRKGGMRALLSVYNTSIQANVDETGARPHFPPYRPGSRLFRWVLRKGLATSIIAGGRLRRNRDDIEDDLRAAASISFLIARAQSRRGLPRPGDALRAPFKTVEHRKRNYIQSSFALPFMLATKRINSLDRRAA